MAKPYGIPIQNLCYIQNILNVGEKNKNVLENGW